MARNGLGLLLGGARLLFVAFALGDDGKREERLIRSVVGMR